MLYRAVANVTEWPKIGRFQDRIFRLEGKATARLPRHAFGSSLENVGIRGQFNDGSDARITRALAAIAALHETWPLPGGTARGSHGHGVFG